MVPRVSVIMPAYNRAEVIGASIESVLAQQFKDFELIVVDDGSSDRTVEVARGYEDPRVRVVELGRNRGSNAARNEGIRQARAPLLAFLDSDDLYLPAKLRRIVAEFEARPELDVLVDSFVKLCGPGAKRARLERVNPRIDDTREFARRLFGRQLWKPTSAISVRRDAAVRAGLFDEGVRRRQDLDFLIRLSEVANCASIDEILWVKCWSADCISAGDHFVPSTIELVRRHPQYLTEADYRRGLSKDLAIHLLRGIKARRFRRVRTDAVNILREFGAAKTARLLREGVREVVSRRRGLKQQRALRPSTSASAAEVRSHV
jgi:glycosyltransferase involved in cell wall biosynthesis